MIFNILRKKIIYILDCTDFTLNKHVGRKVDGTNPSDEMDGMTSGECFFACFDKPGCLTFSHDDGNQRCQLYTGCGASCVLIADSAIITYVRECAQQATGTCSNLSGIKNKQYAIACPSYYNKISTMFNE